jgi:hypothetical protein
MLPFSSSLPYIIDLDGASLASATGRGDSALKP